MKECVGAVIKPVWQGCKRTLAGTTFTYRKLFHLLIGNCFITCHLLIETTVRCAPKFVSTKYFRSDPGTFDLLIELYPMVPFPPIVLEGVSDYTRTPPRPHPCQRLDRPVSFYKIYKSCMNDSHNEPVLDGAAKSRVRNSRNGTPLIAYIL